MMIGLFRKSDDGYVGRLRTLALDVEITIVAAQPLDAENAPTWRLLLGDAERGVEIGAGWNRTGERAGQFIAVQIDDPAFAVPLRANLLRSLHNDGEYHLLWSRPSARERD
jgi:uncharacterized protein (DUF736 family)